MIFTSEIDDAWRAEQAQRDDVEAAMLGGPISATELADLGLVADLLAGHVFDCPRWWAVLMRRENAAIRAVDIDYAARAWREPLAAYFADCDGEWPMESLSYDRRIPGGFDLVDAWRLRSETGRRDDPDLILTLLGGARRR